MQLNCKPAVSLRQFGYKVLANNRTILEGTAFDNFACPLKVQNGKLQ